MKLKPEGKDSVMKSGNTGIEIVEDLPALSHRAAEILLGRIDKALFYKPHFSLALSGGSTPKTLYSLLAKDENFKSRFSWHKVHFFWGDERHVPPDHPDSNFGLANEFMFAKAGVSPRNIHRVRAEAPDVNQAATEYEQELQGFFGLKAGQLPVFDCILLGLGSDGHTASLFPRTRAIAEQKRLVTANRIEKLRTIRITLTVPVINNADLILFLVSGEDKAGVLKKVLEENQDSEMLPSQLIQPTRGHMLWLVDRAAAGRLSGTATLE